ncbi:DUF4168 domain-containing protein [Gracilimonas sp. Q87]|uniref:DUF4168 domain-containing protein n=1 Tax=Gracilimonas sp. Q87 TaxID=3384766 RepID=UPI0039845027
MKTFLKYSTTLILGAIFVSATAFAQQQMTPPQPEPLGPDEVTDEQLVMLSEITKAGEGIQQEAQQKMQATIEETSMEYSRFEEIMMSQQNPQMAGQLDLSEEEQQTIQQVQPQLMQINQEAQQQYMQAIQEAGMDLQTFQQVAQAIQAHPEVAERFEAINGQEDEGDGN